MVGLVYSDPGGCFVCKNYLTNVRCCFNEFDVQPARMSIILADDTGGVDNAL